MTNLPATVNHVHSHSCPGDRVVHADRWQGCLETPSAEMAPFAADFTGYADEAPELDHDIDTQDWDTEEEFNRAVAARHEAPEFEPTDADWDDMAQWCEWCDRNDEIARDERLDDAAAERFDRYGL